MDIPIVLSICVITCLRKITNKNNSFKAIRIFHNRKNRRWIDYAFSLAVYYVLWCSNFCQMVYPNVMCFILIIYVTFFQTLEMFVTFKEILPKFLWIWRRFPPELKMSEVRFELFLSSIKFDWVFAFWLKYAAMKFNINLKRLEQLLRSWDSGGASKSSRVMRYSLNFNRWKHDVICYVTAYTA